MRSTPVGIIVGPYLDRIARLLEDDRGCPRTQRHTARRIFERIAAEVSEGGDTAVRKTVRDLRRVRGEGCDLSARPSTIGCSDG
jgi:hypothetical protein